MVPSLRVIFLLVALLAETTSSPSSKSVGSRSVFRTFIPEDILNDFLLFFNPRNTFMDVFVPPNCLQDNAAPFKTFLNARSQPVILWTNGDMHYDVYHGEDYRFRQTPLYIVYFVCGNYNSNNLGSSIRIDYPMTAFVVSEFSRHPREDPEAFYEMPFLPPYPRASGRYVISFANGTVSLTSEFKRSVVRSQSLRNGLRFKRRQSLSGSCIRLVCTSMYACEHPSFNVTVGLLTHRNASVSAQRLLENYYEDRMLYLSTFVNNLGEGRHMRPIISSMDHFGSAGFSFYVRKPDRVPKEAIFYLPFSREVWVVLVACCLLLVLTYGLIARVTLNANVDICVFIFPMVAAFLQQSVQLHGSLLMTRPSRILYGLMVLMFVVMSTVFKGRLTSLLNDLPLQGEATQFVSFADIIRKGQRLCILESAGLAASVKKGNLLLGGPIKVGYRCYETSNGPLGKSRSIKISADGKDTFFTCNSPTGPSEALRRELLGRGYVETEGTVFSYPVGPEMRASSVYRHDFGRTLGRAIQAGLYVRHAELVEYKRRSLRESSSENPEGLVLNLSDVRPFFLAWFVGVSFSILAFVSEFIPAHISFRNWIEHVSVGLKSKKSIVFRQNLLSSQ